MEGDVVSQSLATQDCQITLAQHVGFSPGSGILPVDGSQYKATERSLVPAVPGVTTLRPLMAQTADPELSFLQGDWEQLKGTHQPEVQGVSPQSPGLL